MYAQRNRVASFFRVNSKQTPAYREYQTEAVMQVAWAFTVSTTPKIIINSFDKVYGLPSTANVLEGKMSLCTRKVSASEINAMKIAMPEAIQAMKKRGQITGDEMNTWNIPLAEGVAGKNKDERAPGGRCALAFTHPEVL